MLMQTLQKLSIQDKGIKAMLRSHDKRGTMAFLYSICCILKQTFCPQRQAGLSVFKRSHLTSDTEDSGDWQAQIFAARFCSEMWHISSYLCTNSTLPGQRTDTSASVHNTRPSPSTIIISWVTWIGKLLSTPT